MEKALVHSQPSRASILLPAASTSTDTAEAQETKARLRLPGPPCRQEVICGWLLRQLWVSVTHIGGPRPEGAHKPAREPGRREPAGVAVSRGERGMSAGQ